MEESPHISTKPMEAQLRSAGLHTQPKADQGHMSQLREDQKDYQLMHKPQAIGNAYC